MEISLVRTCVQKESIKESELIDYIKFAHKWCGHPNCEIQEAIKSNLNNRELIKMFLEIDSPDGFIKLKESSDYIWMNVPTSEDAVKLEIKER
jgi:hypothetical protein|tara:strand:- start:257 stop:535 length:279 start_codon:yes stop_codon:yes gene_type:complete